MRSFHYIIKYIHLLVCGGFRHLHDLFACCNGPQPSNNPDDKEVYIPNKSLHSANKVSLISGKSSQVSNKLFHTCCKLSPMPGKRAHGSGKPLRMPNNPGHLPGISKEGHNKSFVLCIKTACFIDEIILLQR